MQHTPIKPLTALERVFKILGSQKALADVIGISGYAITKWKNKGIPAAQVIKVERAVDGQVTRQELRPDIYPPDDIA